MARFPRTEADLAELIDKMLKGLAAHPKDFPNSDLKGLKAVWEDYRAAKQRQAEAFEAYRRATEPKDAALDVLIAKTKSELKQAEIDTNDEVAKLKKIGWGGATSLDDLPAPGTPQVLRVASPRPNARLEWEPPARGSGGKVQVYEVERRPLEKNGDDSAWVLAGVALEPMLELVDQPAGVQEYRVVARNRKGVSAPSVSVFLP